MAFSVLSILLDGEGGCDADSSAEKAPAGGSQSHRGCPWIDAQESWESFPSTPVAGSLATDTTELKNAFVSKRDSAEFTRRFDFPVWIMNASCRCMV